MSYQNTLDDVWSDLGYKAPGPPDEPSRPCSKQEALQGLAQARAILNNTPAEREHDEQAA